MKSVNTLVNFIKSRGEKRIKRNGVWLYDLFLPSERYAVDFAEYFAKEGWQQYDTDQDAHYFGTWVNPRLMMTLTYAEGDWCLAVCEFMEAYQEEIRLMNEFYGEGFIAKTIDMDGKMTVYKQDRSEFLQGWEE